MQGGRDFPGKWRREKEEEEDIVFFFFLRGEEFVRVNKKKRDRWFISLGSKRRIMD